MAHFNLDQRYFQGKRANIKRPTEIAHFSYNETQVLQPFSDASLRYYSPPFVHLPHVPPPRPIDLKAGFNEFRRKDESVQEHLDSLLATIEALERKDGKKLDVGFITWRGMITRLVTALFDYEDEFEMLATLYQVCDSKRMILGRDTEHFVGYHVSLGILNRDPN